MFSSGGMQKAKQGRLSSAPPDERLNGEPLFVGERKMGQLLVLCGKQTAERNSTVYYCKTKYQF
jgi:hypothetical protein